MYNLRFENLVMFNKRPYGSCWGTLKSDKLEYEQYNFLGRYSWCWKRNSL